jgi:hypothetical protein
MIMAEEMNERRLIERRLEMRRDREILDAARAYDDHQAWCPQCRDVIGPMCADGANLMENLYYVLRTRAV